MTYERFGRPLREVQEAAAAAWARAAAVAAAGGAAELAAEGAGETLAVEEEAEEDGRPEAVRSQRDVILFSSLFSLLHRPCGCHSSRHP